MKVMDIIRDQIELCDDCMMIAVNGDYEVLDYHYGKGPSPGRGELREGAKQRAAEIDAGFERLGPQLVPSFDSETGKGINEFSTLPCECCGSKLYGGRHDFAILG